MNNNMSIEARRGDWIQTFTGKRFYPLDPRPEDINITDIAHALSNQCRFAGHVNQFYSTAQHSVLVSRLLPREFALWGLLHDASEAYLMDIPSPFKYLPEMSTYRTFEAGAQYIIYLKYGCLGPEPPEVKVVDKQMLCVEATNFLGKLLPGWEKWMQNINYKDIPVPKPLSPKEAERLFLFEFEYLTTFAD